MAPDRTSHVSRNCAAAPKLVSPRTPPPPSRFLSVGSSDFHRRGQMVPHLSVNVTPKNLYVTICYSVVLFFIWQCVVLTACGPMCAAHFLRR